MIALVFVAALAAAPVDCAYDKTLLELPPEKFDQDLKGGWRPLGDKPGCETATADLLAAYRVKHWGALKPGELHLNYWHEGQMRAEGGDNAGAVPLLLAGNGPPDDADFADYALGSVAFLQHDKAALVAARARLAGQPEPAWFKASAAEIKAATGDTAIWPLNLSVLDGLIACFDKPYKVAYGACRPAPPARAK